MGAIIELIAFFKVFVTTCLLCPNKINVIR